MPENANFHKMRIFSTLRKKCKKKYVFLLYYLVSSQKSSTFALAFEKQMCFDFLPEVPDIKIKILFEDLIFLRQTEGKSNWKIDTISVVQERILNGRKIVREVPVKLHFNKSVILSYLIIFLFTTKSLILAQDER